MLASPDDYDLDHIVPVAVYPTNELWNLVPADRGFNQHTKPDRLPANATMRQATAILAGTYDAYLEDRSLGTALVSDSAQRFRDMGKGSDVPRKLVVAVARFVATLGEARNLARF